MTRVLRAGLQNQLVIGHRCLWALNWNARKCAVLDIGDLELELRALEIVRHMAVLALFRGRLTERAVEPFEVGGLLEIGLGIAVFIRNLIAGGVVHREHDCVAGRAQLRLLNMGSKYRYYSHRVFHRAGNYIVADLRVAIAGGIRTKDLVGWADVELTGISGRINQVLVGNVMANRARDPVTP